MQCDEPSDAASNVSMTSSESLLRRRPLITLGWDMVLAEERALQATVTAPTFINDGGSGKLAMEGGEDGVEKAVLNGGTAPTQAGRVEEVQRRAGDAHVWRGDAPAVGTVFALTAEAAVQAEVTRRSSPVTSHWATSKDSPPAWTRPSFVGESPSQKLSHADNVVRLQEVFPFIGGRRQRCVGAWSDADGDGTADRWLRESEKEGMVGPNEWDLERFLPSDSVHEPACVVGNTHDASNLMKRGEGRREPGREIFPALEKERSTFSWQEIIQASGGRDKKDTVEEGRIEALQPRGASVPQQLHWLQQEPRHCEEDLVPLQREQIAADAEAVEEMQITANELAHRVLMAERAFAEERAECAVLREDLTRCLEMFELPLQANMSALRELQSENRRLSQSLGL
ncbi:hypothetical protein TraAM80_02275 [Trypanosoma rangeli]|uniref:Uncharacterized protein n=1 Tax=Trypanosoma rangeli TaxID=5698 RepID=A0A3R7NP59_TRYRA|nr:uncharacterized protein TraAM80_02275 [Trypanosoma rangeli]RNF09325.1 hypothetical protein TraAM80_02275 [Trypanosoma rangeli]|eukprot:RNF09325.1 hypothetical protein TraAM80_02275 [Trypanosoma rangeli]